MQTFYEFLDANNYFWDRKDKNHIYVALNGYRVFDKRYERLIAAAKNVKAINIDAQYDSLCQKTFYVFKHK